MFNKIKALNDVRSQAKKIEKVMTDLAVTGEHKGVKVTINGKQEVVAIDIPADMDREDISAAIMKAHNNGMKDVQKAMQQAIKDMGGLPDLSALGL